MTDSASPKERLLRVLQRRPVDRPPVACLGGMMNAAVVDVMERTGNPLPEAYDDPARLARLARDVARLTGFEDLALPFCMTLEAELLGSRVDPGTIAVEARIAEEAFPSVREVALPKLERIPEASRAARVIQAIALAAAAKPDEPIVGSLTGPVSTAASIVDPITFLKELRKERANSHRVLDAVVGAVGRLAEEMVSAGADVIAVSDPTATGEILGPRAFEEFALRYLNELTDRIHRLGAPVVVHICGDIRPVEHLVARLHARAVSTDAVVSLSHLKASHPGLVTMGNVSTQTLQLGEPERIAGRARQLVEDGVDIIAPACGLGTSTPLTHIRALTDAVREG
ncbi:uroporphyrinogen decarboxylase family protein [Anaeromyxobacter oryzisoli]|uniref:uroporphyrinogen decarboxylase family protein n=1 Tax=Anaeromyxobacter oryzisoli TaxID=2925408 RepID=UPI001F56377C|nr:uroporphyrinogen decarboxylase family protein [Anaeromyxobacter sp. SG63]